MKRVGLAGFLLVALALVLQACNAGVVTSEQQAKKAEALRKIGETGHNRPGRDDNGGM